MAKCNEIRMLIFWVILGWYVLLNLLLYGAMALDKRRAKKHQWRIPEKTLFLLAFLGGGLGGILAMVQKRHKTKHISFIIGFPVAMILHILLIVFLLGRILP